jgi:hypothetical protein
MPTKTSKTSKTSTTKKFVTLKNTFGERYIITQKQLREAYGAVSPTSMNLADLTLPNTKRRATTAVPYAYGDTKTNMYGQPYSALVTTDNKTYIHIGCQWFEGVNARKILRAVARAAKVTARKARAAAAGA